MTGKVPSSVGELQGTLNQLILEQRTLLPFQSIVSHTFKLLSDRIKKLENKIEKLSNTTVQNSPQCEEVSIALPTGELKIEMRKISSKTTLLFIPQNQFPTFNFVGRILGPKGSQLKMLQDVTKCKILIRGFGSNKKTEITDGVKSYQPLHLQINIEECLTDFETKSRMDDCISQLLPYLIPTDSDIDTLKKLQLKELAALKSSKQSPTVTKEKINHIRYSPY
ncbi:qki-a [Acrasis kona]|uniref:Qki-a n=1 Tax=Acrasis kona TaxID=1008807 RepID=A0AAW2YK33_9EUKA